MIAYKYKAISQSGEKVTGIVKAYDEFEAVAEIKKTCSIVEDIKPIQEKKKKIDLNEPTSISEKTLSLLSSQFAILIKAGIPMAKAVAQIADATSDKYLKGILEKVAEDVNAGYALHQSLQTRSDKFPATFIETIRAGELSGTLDESFEKMYVYFDRSHKMRGKVKSALSYPIILIVLTIVVVIVVIKVAVPTIVGVIEGGSGEVPGPTKFLLWLYDFMGEYGLIILTLVGIIVAALIVYRKTPQGRLAFARIGLSMPVLGNVNVMNGASQFANSMATLLASGLTIAESLQITGRVMDNYIFKTGIEQCSLGIEEGQKLGDMLVQRVPDMPGLLVEMTAAGENSGKLEETLRTIAIYYDSEVSQTTEKAVKMLEPILTVVMGGIIGFIVIALYLPMFTMYNAM